LKKKEMADVKQWRRDRRAWGRVHPPLLLKILTEFSPILGYAFSHFGVGFLPFGIFFRKWRGSFSPILGQKLPENPPENLKNQDGEQKKKVFSWKIWAEDRKFSEKSNGHPMEQTFSAFLPF
jgi:hypothetical protein